MIIIIITAIVLLIAKQLFFAFISTVDSAQTKIIFEMEAKKAPHKPAGNNLPNDFRQYYCAKTSDERHKKQISLGLIRTCN